MGAINGRLRRHRRNRMAAEMACTWTPRRLFTFGSSVGGAHWFSDPNLLYRRRNRLTYTRDFTNSVWVRTNILSVTADADGVGDLVVPSTASGTHNVTQAVATAGARHVFRVRAKAGGYNWIALQVGSVAKYFNVSTGALGTGSASTSTIEAAADAPGYYDCTIIPDAVSASSNCIVFAASADNTASFTGDGTSGVYIARAQLEHYTTTATEYQDVPTTWPEAYLDAVGAENIFAWTDNAGTTPVTAAGDTIGLSLDRAFGGYRGVELLSNRSFENGSTGWVATAPGVNTITISGGSARFQATGSADAATLVQSAPMTAGKVFEVSFDVLAGSSGFLKVVPIGGATGEVEFACTPGRKVFCSPVNTTNSFVISRVVTKAADAYLTNFSAREIPGTHLTQATGTARPTLSARVNRFIQTESFDTAAWLKTNVTVTAAAGTSPTGSSVCRVQLGSGSDAFLYQASAVGAMPTSGYYKQVWWIKSNTGGTQSFRLFGDGTLDYSGNLTADATWQAFTMTDTANGGSSIGLTNASGFLAADLLVWRADLRTADDAAKNIPAYQRVGATATDHDTDGFPHYALHDGTDDSWASTATVDGSGSDKVTVVAGVTKNSDAASGCVVEHTATSASNNGAFILSAPTSASVYQWRSKGTAQSDAATAASYPAPSSVVLTGTGDIGADVSTLRIAGAQVASAATDQGTGNYANATTYVGSRAGSSLRFNGRIYSLVFRFGAMGEADRNRLEQWTKNLVRLP